jgi:uncharacterized peroxidase-related enzyme
MTNFHVPTREQVNLASQQAFDALQSALGMVPNIYATLALSPTALPDYLALQHRRSSLRQREREVINLVVSEVNGCRYCQSAHTVLGGLAGFKEEEILEIRSGRLLTDARLDALARFTREVAETRGHPTAAAVDAFLAAGFTHENLVDVIVVIGDKTITNYLHGVTQVPIDFPLARDLRELGVETNGALSTSAP